MYRALDTNLGRHVAVKVLPDAFAHDSERLARFEREAKTLASLNHPNIAIIHGLETANGIRALVMELVEGPTLAERIAQGPIPVQQALPIARQITDALDVAHEHGIVHRDLKPANIKVRDDGTVKVLDFGLAKAMQDEASAPDVTHSPTLSVAATRMGVILGTAAYMAPEQAKGKAVDKRADIWAFGCVLYEMLTGQPAFQGEDVSEILASVIKGSTNLELLPAGSDPRLRTLLTRCLERDVRTRIRDIGDVRHELERIQAEPVRASNADEGVAPAPARLIAFWVAGAAVLTSLVVGAAVWMLKPAPQVATPSTTRFTFTLPQNQQFRNTGRPVVAISPDGRHFVYNATGGIYLRSMDALQARLIQGTEETGTNPFFSPDGQWLGYWYSGALKKIPITGGTPVILAKATNPFGASWAADNTIVFGQPEGIMRVSADGGTPEVLVATKRGEELAHGPEMLPGGTWLLFSRVRGTGSMQNRWDVAEIVAQSLQTGEQKVLWRGGSDVHYAPTGHLIYALGDALFALPFDLDRLEVTGGPVALLSGLARAPSPSQQTGTAHYGFSSNGTLIYATAVTGFGQIRTLVWVDRNGREEAIAAPPRSYMAPRISPDGTQAALDIRDQENDIWIWHFARRTLTRLTFDPGLDRYPVWTPDGRRIIFSSQRASPSMNLFSQAADGTGAAERVTESGAGSADFPTSTSSDGTRVLFERQGAPRAPGASGASGTLSADVMIAAVTGERRETPLIATTFADRNPVVSADGRWIAYESNESGGNEVYVRPFPGVDGGRWQVSSGGGTQPLWSKDSRELFYVNPEGQIVAIPIQAGSGFVTGSPQVVIKGSYNTLIPGILGRTYDVSRDGQRFLLLKGVEQAREAPPPAQITVIENWTEELKRLAPTN